MKILKKSLYLDTSIPSAYLDINKPGRQSETYEFWKSLSKYNVFTSDITYNELNGHPDPDTRKELLNLIKPFKRLSEVDESELLVKRYIKFDLFKERDIADATHLAIATVNNIDFLISWNFKHLVNVKTRSLTNLININSGYRVIEIIAPPELQE